MVWVSACVSVWVCVHMCYDVQFLVLLISPAVSSVVAYAGLAVRASRGSLMSTLYLTIETWGWHTHYCAQLLHAVWRFELRSSCWHGTSSTHWTISPGLFVVLASRLCSYWSLSTAPSTPFSPNNHSCTFTSHIFCYSLLEISITSFMISFMAPSHPHIHTHILTLKNLGFLRDKDMRESLYYLSFWVFLSLLLNIMTISSAPFLEKGQNFILYRWVKIHCP